jgi:hypothetical protein
VQQAVYVGPAATIAFLQTARQIVIEKVGPSEFSHGQKTAEILEVELPNCTEDFKQVTVDQKIEFLKSYTSAV